MKIKHKADSSGGYSQIGIILYLVTLGIALLSGLCSARYDQCTNPNATIYDGFLDWEVTSASFSRDVNSSMRFKNPLVTELPMIQEASISLWMAVPNALTPSYSRGTLLDCGNTLSVTLNGTNIRVNTTQNTTLRNGTISATPNFRQSTEANFRSIISMIDWNHVAISIRNRTLTLHINGAQVSQTPLNTTFLARSDFCTLGNSLNSSDPFSGQFRHLVFSRAAFLNTSFNAAHAAPSAQDSSILAYFRFDRQSQFRETFRHRPDREVTVRNVSIIGSVEPEKACFCFPDVPIYALSDNIKVGDLKLPLLPTASNTSDDSSVQIYLPFGVTVQFWAHLRLPLNSTERVLVNITDYASVVLGTANQSSFLFLDLYNQTTMAYQRYTVNHRPTFNSWQLYEVAITPQIVKLFVNQQEVQTLTVRTQAPQRDTLTVRVGPIFSLQVYQHQIAEWNSSNPTVSNLKVNSEVAPRSCSKCVKMADFQFVQASYAEASSVTTNDNGTEVTTVTRQFQSKSSESPLSIEVLQDPQWERVREDYCSALENRALFDGVSCKSPQYAISKPQTQLVSQLSTSTLTPPFFADVWFRPLTIQLPSIEDKSASQTIKTLISLNNTINSTLLAITYSDLGNVSCSFRTDTISVNISLLRNDSWYHVACLISQTQMTLILFESLSQQTSTLSINCSSTQASGAISNITAQLYSDSALLRDIRILRESWTTDQVAAMRSVIFDPKTKRNRDQNAIQINQRLAVPSLVNDSAILNCPQNTLFDGKCCLSSQPELVRINVTKTEGADGMVSLRPNISGIPEGIQQLSHYTWSLIRVVNTLNDTAFLKPRLDILIATQRGSRTLVLPSSLLPLNSSFALSLSVETPIHNMPVILPQFDLTMDCPKVDLFPTQDPIIIQRGYEVPLTIATLPQFQCFGRAAITIVNITWSHNATADPYVLSTNKYNATFSSINQNATRIRVNQTVVFNDNNVLRTVRKGTTVVVLNQTVILDVANLTSDNMIHIPDGQDLVINASQTQFLSNTIPRSEMFFNISCPQNSLVRNITRDCLFNQSTGIFRIPYSQLNLTMPNSEYTLNVTVGKPLSRTATANRTIRVRWFTVQNQIAEGRCPGVFVARNQTLEIQRPNAKNFSYSPTIILDCLNSQTGLYQRFRRQRIIYQLDFTRLAELNQNLTVGRNFSDIFSLNNDNSTFVFRNDSVIQRLRPSDIIPIVVQADFVNETMNVTSETLGFDLRILSSDIVMAINSSHGWNQQNLRNVQIHDDIIINASQSFDPDFSTYSQGVLLQANTSVVNLTFRCNGQACDLPVSQNQRGVLNFTSSDRLRLNLSYDAPLLIEIRATSLVSIFKPPQVQTINFTLAAPSLNTTTLQCPRARFQRIINRTINQTTPNNSITFTVQNASDLDIRISPENCDTLVYQPVLLLLSFEWQNGTIAYQQSNASGLWLNFTRSILLSALPPGSRMRISAYLLFDYQNATTKSRQRGFSGTQFTIIRDFASLIPVLRLTHRPDGFEKKFNPATYEYGPDENIYLDPTSSFDPENATQEYSYQYNCSSNLSSDICSQLQNTQMISRAQLFSLKVAEFWIQLRLNNSFRNSSTLRVQFKLVAQNITRCFQVTDRFSQVSIYPSELQALPIILKPQLQQWCPSRNVSFNSGYIWNTKIDFQAYNLHAQDSGVTSISVNSQPSLSNQSEISVLVQLDELRQPQQVLKYQIQTYREPSFILRVPDTLNSSADYPQYVTVETALQNISCEFTCWASNVRLQNCSASDSCRLDLTGLPGQPTSVQAKILYDGRNYTTERVLVDKQPCKITSPSAYLQDETFMLTVTCPYDSYQVQWLDLQPLNSPRERTIKLPAWYFTETSEVRAFIKYNYTTVITSGVVQLRSNDNIRQGIIQIAQDQILTQYARSIQLQIIDQQDINGGMLFNQIQYNWRDNIFTALSKSRETDISIVIPKEVDEVVWETYDQKGALTSQTLKLSSLQVVGDRNSSETPAMDRRILVDNFDNTTSNDSMPSNSTDNTTTTVDENTTDMSNNTDGLANDTTVIPEPNYDDLDFEILDRILADISPELIKLNEVDSFERASSALYLVTAQLPKNDSKRIRILNDLGNRTLQYLQYFPDNSTSEDLLRFASMKNSLYLNLLAINECLNSNDLLKNATIEFLNRLNQTLLTSKQMIDAYQTLSQTVGIIDPEFQNTLKTNMLPGETLQIQNTLIYRISTDEEKVSIQKGKVGLDLPLNSLGLLNLTQDGFISIKSDSEYKLERNNTKYENLTIYSDVVEVEISDSNLTKVSVSDISNLATLVFNLSSIQGTNITCGYYNEDSNEWDLGESANLTTSLNNETNQALCTTTHFSRFAIFNLTVLAPEVIVEPGNSEEESRQRYIVNYVQLGLIVFAVLLFLIQLAREHSQKQELLEKYDFTKLEFNMDRHQVCAVMSPYQTICRQPFKLNLLARILVFLNYLLYISIFALVNMTLLAPDYRILEDTIYLVGAIVAVFLFSAPLLKDLLLYSWLTFTPVHTFATVARSPKALTPSLRKVKEPDITERPLEVKPETFESGVMPNSVTNLLNQSNKLHEPHDGQQEKASEEVKESTVGGVSIDKGHPIGANNQEDQANLEDSMQLANDQYYFAINNHQWREETVEKKSIQDIEQRSYSPPPRMGTVPDERGRQVRSRQSIMISAPVDLSYDSPRSSENEYVKDSQNSYSKKKEKRPKTSPIGVSHMKVVDKIATKNQIFENFTQPNNIDDFDRNDSYQFEGGEDRTKNYQIDINGGGPPGETTGHYGRSAFNTAAADLEQDDLVLRFKKNDPPQAVPTTFYYEQINSNEVAITLLQLIFFFAGAIAAGFLFKEARIQETTQIKVYFASVFIAVGILLIIFDLLITLVGVSLIKNRGLSASRYLSAAIIFGFIGFKRIRCLQ